MDIVQIVIQAGAVGIAVYVVYVLKGIVTNHIRHTNNHIQNNTVSQINLKNAINKLVEFLEKKLK